MRCMRCGIYAEDIQHLITECHWYKQVWNSLSRKIGSNISDLSLGEWWKTVDVTNLQGGGKKTYRQAFITYAAWMIWKQRNQIVFEQKVMKTEEVVPLVVNQVEEQWNVLGREDRVGRGFRHMQNQIEKWTRPKEGWIKVNFDGAWLDDIAGVGVIVQSSDVNS